MMGKMYVRLKEIPDEFMKDKISADTYLKKMKNWKKEADKRDGMAPCPKNKWQTYYTKLTPIHQDICFAWTDLKALNNSLLVTDGKMVIYHESEYKKGMKNILKIFKNPELNKEKNPFQELLKQPVRNCSQIDYS